MIRLALPKGRNLPAALAALRAAGLGLKELDNGMRRLRQQLPEDKIEVLMLKDWDLPLYVEYGIADCGVVGSDVTEEIDCDLLVPCRLLEGRCRLSLIGRSDSLPPAGSQIRVATKYPNLARRFLSDRPWGAEILKLSGSVELGPLLELAEMAFDIVQTGATLKENHLVEIEEIQEVAPCFVVNRASYQRHREDINHIVRGLEKAKVVS